MERRVLLIGAVILLLIVGGGAVYSHFKPYPFFGEVISPSRSRPDFTLQSSTGPVSLSDFRGKFVLLYFGYTSCPDLCPTTLANLRRAVDNLGSNSDEFQVVFVSVDWKRDTPEHLADYVHAFRPDFVGLTGTQSQIDTVTKNYGIYYKLNPPDQGGFYSVDHTAIVQVLDPQQNLVLIWPYGILADQMTSDLRGLLRRSPGKQ